MARLSIVVIIIGLSASIAGQDARNDCDRELEELKQKGIAALFDLGGTPQTDGMTGDRKHGDLFPIYALKNRPIDQVVDMAARRLSQPAVNPYDHPFAVSVLTHLRPAGYHEMLLTQYPHADSLGKEEILRYLVTTHEVGFKAIAMQCLMGHRDAKVELPIEVFLGAWYFGRNPATEAVGPLEEITRKIAEGSLALPPCYLAGFPYNTALLQKRHAEYVIESALQRCRTQDSARTGAFGINVHDLDPQKSAPLTAAILTETLGAFWKAADNEVAGPASRLALLGMDAISALLKKTDEEGLTDREMSRLSEGLGLVLTVTERKTVLDPVRKAFAFQDLNLRQIGEMLQTVYPWEGFKDRDLFAFYETEKISIALANASLADAMAAVCDRYDLLPFVSFGILNSGEGQGHSAIESHNRIQARDGLLYYLQFRNKKQVSGVDYYSIEMRCLADLAWTDINAKFRLLEATYADGSRFAAGYKPEAVSEYSIPEFHENEDYLEPLKRNQGKFAVIKGRLTVALPLQYTVHIFKVGPEVFGKRVWDSARFIELRNATFERGKWWLGIEFGDFMIDGYLPVDPGRFLVYDKNMHPIVTRWGRWGGGGYTRNHYITDRDNRYFESLTEKPCFIVWYFPSVTEDYSFPVEFRDVQVASSVWAGQREQGRLDRYYEKREKNKTVVPAP